VVAETLDILGVSARLLTFDRQSFAQPLAQGARKRRGELTGKSSSVAEDERALPASSELAIDIDENFRIEQRAVPDSPRAIDAVAIAQSVEAVRLSGMLSSRQHKRVDDPVHADRLTPEPRQLRVDEAHIEFGIVDDERRITDEGEKFVDDAGEDRLVLEGGGGVAVDAGGVLGDVALRVW
jgi:hypothetical protein